MAKKLKVYQTSLGFFDLAIAAPSMKAAAEAWQSNPDIFQRGFAKETSDPKVVKATMASPGVVLRRPAGSDQEFTTHASLPKVQGNRKTSEASSGRGYSDARKVGEAGSNRTGAREQAKRETEETRKALEREKAAAEREEKQREKAEREAEEKQARERRKAAEEREREKKQRERAVARLDADLERARGRHDEALRSVKKQREDLDRAEARAEADWERARKAHAEALKDIEP